MLQSALHEVRKHWAIGDSALSYFTLLLPSGKASTVAKSAWEADLVEPESQLKLVVRRVEKDEVKEEKAALTPAASVVSLVVRQAPNPDSSSSAAEPQESQQAQALPPTADEDHIPATPTNSDASEDEAAAGTTASKGKDKGKATTRTTSRETLAAQADGEPRPSSSNLPSQEQPANAPVIAEPPSNAALNVAPSPRSSHRAPSLPPVLPADSLPRSSPKRAVSPSPSNLAAEEARKAEIRAGKKAMPPSPMKERRSSDASATSWFVGVNRDGAWECMDRSPARRATGSPSKETVEEEEMEVDEQVQESGASGEVGVDSQEGAMADDDEMDGSDGSMVKDEPKSSQTSRPPPATGHALKAHSSGAQDSQPTQSASKTGSYPSNASPPRIPKPSNSSSPATTRKRKGIPSSPPTRESPRWDHTHKRARFADEPLPSASAPPRSTAPHPLSNNSFASTSLLPPPPATQLALQPPSASQPPPASQVIPASQRSQGRKSLSAEEKARLLRSLPREAPKPSRPDREARWHIWLRLPNDDQGPNSAGTAERFRKKLHKLQAMGGTGITLGRTMRTLFDDAVAITGWSMRDLRLRWTPLIGEEGEEPEEGDEAMIWGFDTLLHEFRDLEEAGIRSGSVVDVDLVPFKKGRIWSDWD